LTVRSDGVDFSPLARSGGDSTITNMPSSFLNHNPNLEKLTLMTPLDQTLSFLLKDAHVAAEQAEASPGLQNVEHLTLGASAVEEIGSLFIGSQTTAEGVRVLRNPREQKRLCEAAFRGLHQAIKICVTSPSGNLLIFSCNRVSLRDYEALDELSDKLAFTRAEVIRMIAQAPALKRLELPEIFEINDEIERSLSPGPNSQVASNPADKTAIELSVLHPKIRSLRVGKREYKRQTAGEDLALVKPAESVNQPAG
jgi:hypothetical protein